MLPLPVEGLEVLQPKERRAVAVGSVLVKPGVNPKDWPSYQGLLADRARWLVQENQGNTLPLGERLFEAGLLPWEEEDPEVCLAALQSPQARDHLRNLGLELPLARPIAAAPNLICSALRLGIDGIRIADCSCWRTCAYGCGSGICRVWVIVAGTTGRVRPSANRRRVDG